MQTTTSVVTDHRPSKAKRKEDRDKKNDTLTTPLRALQFGDVFTIKGSWNPDDEFMFLSNAKYYSPQSLKHLDNYQVAKLRGDIPSGNAGTESWGTYGECPVILKGGVNITVEEFSDTEKKLTDDARQWEAKTGRFDKKSCSTQPTYVACDDYEEEYIW